MTVNELINMLQVLPNQDQLIVLDGYEGGYTEHMSIEEIPLTLNVNTEPYYGEHESPRIGYPHNCIAYALHRYGDIT
jgi:hypothetical protein